MLMSKRIFRGKLGQINGSVGQPHFRTAVLFACAIPFLGACLTTSVIPEGEASLGVQTEVAEVASVVEDAPAAGADVVAPEADAKAQPKARKFGFGFLKRNTSDEGTSDIAEAAGASTSGAVAGSAIQKALEVKSGGNGVFQLVRTYAAYRNDLEDIAQAPLGDKSNVAMAHQRLTGYDHETLAKAWVAYNSAVAAQETAFASEVAKTTKRQGASSYLTSLQNHPEDVFELRSSGRAAKKVLTSITNETAQIRHMAASFRQASYDLQLSKVPAPIGKARQYALKDLFIGGLDGGFIQASNKGSDMVLSNPNLGPGARPMIGKMLTVGAHMSLDRAEGKYATQTDQLVANSEGVQCLKWAKLNLAQCLAAARDVSEEAFCTGRHGLKDVAACWSYMTMDASDT